MDAKEIKAAVIGVLKDVQEISGEEYVPIGPRDKPLGKLEGFDSLKGIEATEMVQDRLGCDIGRDSLFVSEDGTCATTLAEICSYLGEITTSASKEVA